MSLKGRMAEDFSDIFLDDWASTAEIEHITGKTANLDSGDPVTVSSSEDAQVILENVTQKDQAMFPDLLKITDHKMRVSLEDLTTAVIKNDKVTIDSAIYIVLQVAQIERIQTCFMRLV